MNLFYQLRSCSFITDAISSISLVNSVYIICYSYKNRKDRYWNSIVPLQYQSLYWFFNKGTVFNRYNTVPTSVLSLLIPIPTPLKLRSKFIKVIWFAKLKNKGTKLTVRVEKVKEKMSQKQNKVERLRQLS